MIDPTTKLPLIAHTTVRRFVSIDERVVVRIVRWSQPDVYDPPDDEGSTEVWGSCQRTEPDSFREIGTLEEALHDIAPAPMIVAAAIASPRCFAEMVACAHGLGRVIAVGSLAIMALADRVKNPGRFTAIAVAHDVLTFYTLVAVSLFGEDVKTSGVYAASYSLTSSSVAQNELVLAYPTSSDAKG